MAVNAALFPDKIKIVFHDNIIQSINAEIQHGNAPLQFLSIKIFYRYIVIDNFTFGIVNIIIYTS